MDGQMLEKLDLTGREDPFGPQPEKPRIVVWVTPAPHAPGGHCPWVSVTQPMFAFIVQAITAWNQVLALIGAATFGAVGGLLLGNRLYWRFGAQRVHGTIIGVRETAGHMCYAMYRYAAPDGTSREAISDVGTNATAALETGRSVSLLVFAKHADKASDADNYVLDIVGAVFSLAAGLLGYYALTAWRTTWLTWALLAVAILLAAKGIHQSTAQHPATATPPLASRPPDDLHSLPIRPVEEILARPEMQSRLAQQRRQARIARPVLALIGVALLGAFAFLGESNLQLARFGESTAGRVVRVEAQGTSGHVAYYPVVRFTTRDGRALEFRDAVGTNPSIYHGGESVPVQYLAGKLDAKPRIDHGIWNWAGPLALLAFGVLLLLGACRSPQDP